MSSPGPRPADVCRGLLGALDAADGRRRRRKRDTQADGIGLWIKRDLLENAVRDDPAPDQFEGWLLDRCLAAAGTLSVGAVRAMASDILAEWQLASASPEFCAWLECGAPSDDRDPAAADRATR
jgi:hypothetical protein